MFCIRSQRRTQGKTSFRVPGSWLIGHTQPCLRQDAAPNRLPTWGKAIIWPLAVVTIYLGNAGDKMAYLNSDTSSMIAAIDRHARELFESGAGLWTTCWEAAVEAIQIQTMDFYLFAPTAE